MGLFGWLRALVQRDSIPPPGADMLGAATLVKETGASLTQGGEHVSNPYKLPHVVIAKDTRGQPVSERCAALVAKWEGFKEHAYICPAGVWTIGYGATRWPDGRRVKAGETITRATAQSLLHLNLKDFAEEVDRMVYVPLNEAERSALVSFAFNVGGAAFGSSTLLRLLNAGDREGAAKQFHRWNRGGGRELPGLVARRKEEADMFRGAA